MGKLYPILSSMLSSIWMITVLGLGCRVDIRRSDYPNGPLTAGVKNCEPSPSREDRLSLAAALIARHFPGNMVPEPRDPAPAPVEAWRAYA